MHAAITRRLPPPGPQPAPYRVPCLRPSAESVQVQPAPELGHLPRHGHVRHVSGALLPAPCPENLQLRAPPCTRCAALTRGLPPPGPQPAPHHVCPAFDPRQHATAFNQPLSWDISSITTMHDMFSVRCSPRARPLTICTHAPSTLRAACAPRSCPYICMLLAPQSSAHRTPPTCPLFSPGRGPRVAGSSEKASTDIESVATA